MIEETILPPMQPKITIIHPSRQRPALALETVKKWMLSCDMPAGNVQYILSLDNDDPELPQYVAGWESLKFTTQFDLIALHNNASAMEAINNCAWGAAGNIIIVVSDDFDCPDG